MHQNMFSFGLSCAIYKVCVADFEHAFVSQETYRITIAVVLILKYLTQQRNTYSISATETLKPDVESVKS